MPQKIVHRDAVLAVFYRKEYDRDRSDWYYAPLFAELCPPYSKAFIEDTVKELVSEDLLGTSLEMKFEHQVDRWRDIWKKLVPSGAQQSLFITTSGMETVEQILLDRNETIYEYVSWLKTLK